MPNIAENKLKQLAKNKNSLSLEEKKKLLYGLKLMKKKLEKENAMTMSPQEPMWISDAIENQERNVISKTFKTEGNYNAFVNQNRGIQFSPKEMEAITNFKNMLEPTALDPFMVRFETTDDFGNNSTTTIKKFKQGNQFVFTSFSSHDQINEPEKEEPEQPQMPQGKGMTPPTGKPAPGKPTATPAVKPPQGGKGGLPPLKEANEPNPNEIIVTKTITFSDEIQGADILADFLRKIDL